MAISTSSLAGAIAEADAIAYFSKAGYTVSIPFAPTSYDLVIEKHGTFSRVQCKYTSRLAYRYRVEMKHSARRLRDLGGFDLLYVLTFDNVRFLLPAAEIETSSHTLLLFERWRIAEVAKPATNIFPAGKCRRCFKPHEGVYKCCDACRGATSETQRQYRKRKRDRLAGR